jgi:hypothetical protein
MRTTANPAKTAILAAFQYKRPVEYATAPKDHNDPVHKATAGVTMRRQPRREEAGAIEEIELIKRLSNRYTW